MTSNLTEGFVVAQQWQGRVLTDSSTKLDLEMYNSLHLLKHVLLTISIRSSNILMTKYVGNQTLVIGPNHCAAAEVQVQC